MKNTVDVLFNPLLGRYRVHTFPINLGTIGQLEFELVYYDVVVQHVSHNPTETQTTFFYFVFKNSLTMLKDGCLLFCVF